MPFNSKNFDYYSNGATDYPETKDYLMNKNENACAKKDSAFIKIQDDEEGHLIYAPGDILYERCKLLLREIFIQDLSKAFFILIKKNR